MNPYILLAKQAVENYIKNGNVVSLKEFSRGELTELLNRQAGTFVTVIKNGELRGCIGTYLPTKENVAEEIIHNAVAAATEDYRFGPIQKTELPHLSYAVYLLNNPELVKDIKTLDPKKYGIIVKTEVPLKSGLLLPDLEGVDTIEKQIFITCQKAGINPQKEKILIQRFTVEKYE